MPLRPSRLIPGMLMAVLLAACSVSVSTAHIGSLSIGAQKDFTAETTTFAPTDTIYAQATADNLPNAVTLNWTLTAVSVTGQASNAPVPGTDLSMNMAQDGTSSASYTAPNAGWPTGTYRITVTMVDSGTQRDQKTEEFTVSASGGSSTGPSSLAPSSAPSAAPSSPPAS